MDWNFTNKRGIEYWASECESLGEDHLVNCWAQADSRTQKVIGRVLENRKRERDNERKMPGVETLDIVEKVHGIQIDKFWMLAGVLVISVLIMAFSG